MNRDPSADGAFYYGVRTTGVYCRPTCPSRRPKRENVVFFDEPADAERAGFRQCSRCRPGEVTVQQQAVARARLLLDAPGEIPTLIELAAETGFSPWHLQRVFKRHTGLTPRQYAADRRAARLKENLKNGSSVTEAMYDAGYGSSRAVYASARSVLGMTPGRYRDGGRGERISYAVVDTALGPMMVAATPGGLCALRFGEEKALLDQLRAEFPGAEIARDEGAVQPYINAAAEYLSGRRASLDLPLDVQATDFQRRVWDTLRLIPRGETRTYSQIAAMIGEPRAARAVARACAANPVALAIPCHRVIGSGGELRGYRWGVERKRALLAREGALGGNAREGVQVGEEGWNRG